MEIMWAILDTLLGKHQYGTVYGLEYINKMNTFFEKFGGDGHSLAWTGNECRKSNCKKKKKKKKIQDFSYIHCEQIDATITTENSEMYDESVCAKFTGNQ